MSRWLLVGAMGVETLPLLRRLERGRPLTRRLVVGRVGPHEVGVLTVGVGPAKARRRTLAGLARWTPDRVVSIGTCGALVDGLPIGAVRAVDALMDDHAPLARLAPLGALPAATLATVDRAVWTPLERERLARFGAHLVDMEAAAVWRALQEARPGLPVHAVKVVSDLAGGAPDPAVSDPGRPGPAAIARFKARAARLVEQALAPALWALLADGLTPAGGAPAGGPA